MRFPFWGLFVVLLCHFAGTTVAAVTALPLPGAVIGLCLFFAYLSWRRPGPGSSEVRAADGLLANMQLFFIPPGVGIVAHLALLRSEWLPAAGGLVASWAAAMIVTAATAALLLRFERLRPNAPRHGG